MGFTEFAKKHGLLEDTPAPDGSEGSGGLQSGTSDTLPQRSSIAEILIKRRPTDGSGVPMPSPAVSQAASSVGSPASIDPELLDHFAMIADRSKLVGYGDFHRQMEALREFIPDEALRCRAALKSSGGNPQAVIDAINDRIGLVTEQRTGALAAFETQKREELTNCKTKTEGIASRIADLKREIADREEQIRSLTSEQQQASAELSSIEMHYANGSRDLKAAADAMLNGLAQQREKLQALAKP